MKTFIVSLLWLLISLIVLFTGLGILAHYLPSPLNGFVRKAESLATPR